MKWTLLANQLWPNQFVLNTLLLILAIVAIPKPAQAFDTGHHFDLTQDAMNDQGFGKTAIEVTQLENWLTDYYSNGPINGITGIKDEVNKLHFDNLFTTQQVSNYWGRLTVNTRDAVQQATRERDALKLLTVMGISLHSVQDFYSHSNWADINPKSGNSYRTNTWFSQPPVDMNVFTGKASWFKGTAPEGHPKHGGYSSGMNSDDYGREYWEESYTFAYAASREWVNAMRTWSQQVDPNFWSQVQTFNVSGVGRLKLNSDLKAMYRLSEWATFEGNDGHWKGKGSGSHVAFLKFATEWVSNPDPGPFVFEFRYRTAYQLINKGLTGDSPPTKPVPVVPHLPLQHRAVIVRTLKAAETNDVGVIETGLDRVGDADFYANITVAGQKFTEATQQDKASVSPNWTTIRFVRNNVTTVPILYQLFDEDGLSDDHADINPKTGVRDLKFSLNVNTHALSGDLTGVHHTWETAVTSTGKKPDNDRASVQLFVTEKPLVP